MSDSPLLMQYEQYNLYARQFESGARKAAEQQGYTVVIDVFRASNTMLELMNAGAKVKPVTTIDEMMDEKYASFIKVGEDQGEKIGAFDFDNSPVNINKSNGEFFGKDVVIRTTNGTRGILAALGSSTIIVGTFRNLSAVVDICLSAIEQKIPVSFVGMGTLEETRIEDEYCARMFVIEVLKRLGEEEEVERLTGTGANPWDRNWSEEIMKIRGDYPPKLDDYHFSLEVDATDIVPFYNPSTGFLEQFDA